MWRNGGPTSAKSQVRKLAFCGSLWAEDGWASKARGWARVWYNLNNDVITQRLHGTLDNIENHEKLQICWDFYSDPRQNRKALLASKGLSVEVPLCLASLYSTFLPGLGQDTCGGQHHHSQCNEQSNWRPWQSIHPVRILFLEKKVEDYKANRIEIV